MKEDTKNGVGWFFAVFAVFVLLFSGFIFYLLFWESSGLSVGENIESATVSRDGERVQLNLKDGEGSVSRANVIFTDKKGIRHYYEVVGSIGSVDIEIVDIVSNESGLDDFNEAESVDVIFEYDNVSVGRNVSNDVEEVEGVVDSEVGFTTKISQYGITWVFDGEVEYGRFANGDYWVVGPVVILSKSPASEVVDGYYVHGSMINPWANVQAYDERGANFRRDLAVSFPYEMGVGESLVSTISVMPINFSNWDGYSRGKISDAVVLTSLDSVPPEGSFRPPYAGKNKEIKYNVEQLNYSFLGRLPLISGTPRLKQMEGDEQINDASGWNALSRTSVERLFERPWIDHAYNWWGQHLRPWNNMRDYGREISEQVGVGALMLNMNFSDAEKETLYVRMVQIGIDSFGVLNSENGEGVFEAAGGHSGHRKFPLFLAAYGLDSGEMRDVIARSGDYLYFGEYEAGNEPVDYVNFGADDQTFYVKQSDVDMILSPDSRDVEVISYGVSDLGLPEWGISHNSRPESSNKYWGTVYRSTTASSWAGWIFAVQVMGLKDEWNHDALFDYMDRYMEVAKLGWGFRQNNDWTENVWDAYRNDFGCVWTLDDVGDSYSHGSCV